MIDRYTEHNVIKLGSLFPPPCPQFPMQGGDIKRTCILWGGEDRVSVRETARELDNWDGTLPHEPLPGKVPGQRSTPLTYLAIWTMEKVYYLPGNVSKNDKVQHSSTPLMSYSSNRLAVISHAWSERVWDSPSEFVLPWPRITWQKCHSVLFSEKTVQKLVKKVGGAETSWLWHRDAIMEGRLERKLEEGVEWRYFGGFHCGRRRQMRNK